MRRRVLSTYAMTLDTARRLVEGVPDERFADLPHPGAKHPGWVLGHLCVARGIGAAMLSEDPDETTGIAGVPPDWARTVSPKCELTTDRSDYAAKDRLLSELERVHAMLAERFAAASDALLAEALPRPDYRAFFPTRLDCVFYMMAHHEGYHLGQLSCWRRAMGYPPAASC